MPTLPPYITTQELRLWNRPVSEYFVGADGADDSTADRRAGEDRTGEDKTWIPATRDELLAGATRPADGAAAQTLTRVVVDVDSGRGKTSLLRRLAMEVRQHPDSEVREVLPVRLDINQLPPTTDDHPVSDEEILDSLGEILLRGNQELNNLVDATSEKRQRLRAWLAHERANGRLLLLLDALDQARAGPIETLRRMLSGDLPAWNGCRCVLTGRPSAIKEFNNLTEGLFENPANGWQVVQLQPFTDENQQDFLGLSRWQQLPPAARTLLATPRICEYMRGPTDEEAATMKTEADVFYGSLRRMISAGLMAEVARSFGPGCGTGSLPVTSRAPRRGRSPGGQVTIEADPRQIAAALCLLSALAFEMICLPNSDTKNLRNEVTSDEYDAFLDRVQSRVRNAPSCGWDNAHKFRDDVRRLYDINVAEFEFWFFDTHNYERLTELRFRDATIKEFLAAYYAAKHGTKDDARKVEQWIFLPDRPVGDTDTNPQFAWFWRYLCEMPKGGRSPESWLMAIAPLYRPSDAGRPCEMMYRAWKTLTTYQPEALARPDSPTKAAARDGLAGASGSYGASQLASEIVNRFLGEFPAILNGTDLKKAKIAAELVPEPVLEILVNDQPRLEAIRPSDDAPAFVRCPPLEVEQAELKQRGEQILEDGLNCHRFWRGTNVDARDRDGNELWSWGREDPRHEVRLTPFWLKATHVTRAEFALFDSTQECAWRNNLSKYATEESCPVVDVSWYQSWCLAVWCGCEMPMDAQFEFGVRAGRDGEQDLFPQGDTASSFQFNCNGTHPFAGSNAGPDLGHTIPVRCRHPLQDGQPIENVDYTPNEWGIWQPVGQALVWCADWFDAEEYQRCHEKGLVMNPIGPESGRFRVRRGGAWYGSLAACRSAFRGWSSPVNRDDVTGLRLVCVASGLRNGLPSLHR